MNNPCSTGKCARPDLAVTPSSNGGPLGRVVSAWTLGDQLGAIGVRLNIGRMRYRVAPGLYALGTPGPDAPVLVSANYKLSFDHLRRALAGANAWILVLDTKGINVWCAAGKGTFGTAELVRKIHECRLQERVTHRRLILPQLGAPGVAAHEVRKQTGFAVAYGPVYAADLVAFLQADGQATPRMRRIRFRWYERLVLAPLELVVYFRQMLLSGLALALLVSVTTAGPFWPTLWLRGVPALLLWVLTCGLASLLGPLLLPWLPTRVFSVKGACLGAVLALAGLGLLSPGWSVLRCAAWLLLVTAGASHLLLKFTGSTTFTSPSGVRREVRVALSAQIAVGLAGLVAWTAAGFLPAW